MTEVEIEIEDEILPHAWRNLCAGMIVQAAIRVEECFKLKRSYDHFDRIGGGTAMRWLEGGDAVVTFEEACEASGLNAEMLRKAIIERARSRKRMPQWHPDRPKKICRPRTQ
jgi:hypothetical protein